MTPRERLCAALEGQTPDLTPLSIYSWMIGDADAWRKDEWARLLDQGLCLLVHAPTVRHVEHGVKEEFEEKKEGDTTWHIYRKVTPVGTLQKVNRNGWHHEDWIKTPQDYKIRQWIVEHTEVLPDFDSFSEWEEKAGENGLCIQCTSRTPLMSINIDWAGTEQFCEDIGNELEELYDLYNAQRALFMKEVEIVAKGPARFIKTFENLTLNMIGPKRYREFLMPVYRDAYPLLEKAGKRVFVHYDGALKPIKDDIAKAPFHGIESLTEPPEGNMLYDECRAAWPDKVFWAHINIECYHYPADKLRQAVIDRRNRAGKKGLAFEISEDLPSNWQESIPIVLKTLEELG